MNQNDIWREFNALPPDAQRQVMDFILFLQARYKLRQTKVKPKLRRDISKEDFVGMWRNRDDMHDSSAWVKTLREREWDN